MKYELKSVKPESVLKVYSGKPNKCMCGCAGHYAYRPAANSPGYEVERSDHKVDALVRNMNKMLASRNCRVDYDDKYGNLLVSNNTRQYVAYFRSR